MICHYWYFLDKGFKYESHLCNSCQNLMQKTMSKNDAISIMKNSDLNEKIGLL